MSNENEDKPITGGATEELTTAYYSHIVEYAPEIAQEEARLELRRVWGWVLACGVLNLLLGIICLVCPAWTSNFVLWVAGVALLVVGIFHAAGLWYAEPGMKHATLWIGVAQIVLALVILWYPLQSLTGITLAVALAFLFEGLYRVTVAHRNKDTMPTISRVIMITGAINILLSIFITAFMSFFATYAIGILVGCNLVTHGVSRIYTARMAFKELSEEDNAVADDTATDKKEEATGAMA